MNEPITLYMGTESIGVRFESDDAALAMARVLLTEAYATRISNVPAGYFMPIGLTRGGVTLCKVVDDGQPSYRIEQTADRPGPAESTTSSISEALFLFGSLIRAGLAEREELGVQADDAIDSLEQTLCQLRADRAKLLDGYRFTQDAAGEWEDRQLRIERTLDQAKDLLD